MVLWPENASDIDPLRNPDAAAAIDRAARAVGVPIVLGTVLAGPGRTQPQNSVLVWAARASASSTAPTSGGCSPSASTCRGGRSSGCCPSYADRAGNFVPGHRARARSTPRASGSGIAICWEIAFDDLVADSVAAGAQVLAVPSNNATFGRSDMTYQQLAMSRVRAVEHDRAVLVVTTSGVSATIAPDGTVTATTSSSPPMCWSTQRRCGPPLRSQVGCGPSPSGCCRQSDWQGSGWRCAPSDDGAHGRRHAQERTRMAEGSDRARCWW